MGLHLSSHQTQQIYGPTVGRPQEVSQWLAGETALFPSLRLLIRELDLAAPQLSAGSQGFGQRIIPPVGYTDVLVEAIGGQLRIHREATFLDAGNRSKDGSFVIREIDSPILKEGLLVLCRLLHVRLKCRAVSSVTCRTAASGGQHRHENGKRPKDTGPAKAHRSSLVRLTTQCPAREHATYHPIHPLESPSSLTRAQADEK